MSIRYFKLVVEEDALNNALNAEADTVTNSPSATVPADEKAHLPDLRAAE